MAAEEDANRPMILLVEDEINLARPLHFNLEQEGYRVRATPSGREALQWLQGERFDLIILDIMIEEMDGFEVARRIRKRDQRLPILMLTARTAEADRVLGLEIGADDYLVKPFHLRELLLRVRRMLQRGVWYSDRRPTQPRNLRRRIHGQPRPADRCGARGQAATDCAGSTPAGSAHRPTQPGRVPGGAAGEGLGLSRGYRNQNRRQFHREAAQVL